ncbi:MAG TPA: hypothetical protein VFE53_12715 [Mucilaginibacter sp.]|jgi:hypothetical protein|nr:hypothetical protein [Mucilaginibacter sp.]
MKKLMILSAVAMSGLMIYNTADAQIRVGVNLGIQPQPVIYTQAPAIAAAPAFGNGDDYYYLPDLGVYYDVTDQCYVYFDGTEWVFSAYLPGQYANYDWTTARRFEIRAFRPYQRDDFYRERYNGNRVSDWGRANYNDHANGGYRDQDRGREDNRGYNRPANNGGYVNQGYNRANGGYNQPVENRTFNRPAQPYRPAVQQPENRVNSQPAYHNRGGDNRGGAEHFTQTRAQNNFANRKMSKF